MFNYDLGKEAKDKITGIKGIIVGRIEYLFGCNQYGIASRASKDGKCPDTQWFDEGRIQIIGKGITSKEVTADKPGADFNRDCPRGR